jgi:lipoate-protein ligase A
MRLLDCGTVSYARSQAIYHAVAEALTADAPDTLVVLSPDSPYFCIGFHQDPRQELDLDYCREHHYPVLRRRVGGGTTYLDANQLFYQLIVHHRRAPAMVSALYAFALRSPLETLRALGLNAELRHANELVVNGKRIAGTGAGRIGEASVVVGNFLFDFDYAAMANAWQTPNANYRQMAREGLERYVTTLRREMANAPAMHEVKALLIEKYGEVLRQPLAQGVLTADEERLVREAEHELASDEWLLEMRNPPRRGLKIADGVWMFADSCYLLIGGSDGLLTVSARLRHGRVDALDITAQNGFGGPVWGALASSMLGMPFERASIEARIGRFQDAGLIPAELNLEPMVKVLLKFGHNP